MAEHSFQEVMHQFDRMCKANPGCFNCPLHHSNYYSDDESHIVAFVRYPEKIEQAVMQWAAENPEPVYPTWRDALLEYGLLYIKNDNKGGFEIAPNWPQMAKQIPADIAEKLGIEPKEG